MQPQKLYKILNKANITLSLVYCVGLFYHNITNFDAEYSEKRGIINYFFLIQQTEGERYVAFIEYMDSGLVKETRAYYDLSTNIKEKDSVNIYIPLDDPERAFSGNKFSIILAPSTASPLMLYFVLTVVFKLIFKKNLNDFTD